VTPRARRWRDVPSYRRAYIVEMLRANARLSESAKHADDLRALADHAELQRAARARKRK
jgi:hypothetical protein